MKAILAACALLGGCTLIQPPAKPAPAPPSPLELLPMLTIGKSTKADVVALLGEAVVVDFPSGYEVWVYKEKSSAPSAAELVLLFSPSGLLTKTRTR